MIASDRLQIEFLVRDRGNISNYIYNRRRDPAEVIQLIELDIQPVAVDIPPAHTACVAGVQVRSVEIGNGGPIAAMRLLIDGHGWKRKRRSSGDGW